MINKLEETKKLHFSKTTLKPEVAVILGSGLSDFSDQVSNQTVISYREIPHFKTTTAEGHHNQLIFGKIANKAVVLMKGRFHYYEGYSLEEVTFPIRVFKALGVKYLIVTNAAGAVNKSYHPGELMLIKDHLNLVGNNPLIGSNDDNFGPRFLDLSIAYDEELRTLVKSKAKNLPIKLNEGVYAWWSGPSYETPAEIKMIRTLGGDAVGMSTVPEVIVARHSGIKVIGISGLTNMASGIFNKPLNHLEVIEVASTMKVGFGKLIKAVIEAL
jgi:purine-nucleoside phosphorylase